MVLTEDVIINNHDPNVYFALEVHPFQFLLQTWNYEKTAAIVAGHYTTYFGKQFSCTHFTIYSSYPLSFTLKK
jgi:cytolysin (calcineurin-like family phosphatase)